MGSWPLIECGFGRWRRCYRFLGQILPSLRFPPNLCPVPMSTYFHFRLSQNPKKGVSDPNDNDDPLRRYAQALVGNTARVQWVSKAKNQRVKCNETPLLPKDTRVHSRGGKTTQNDTEDFQVPSHVANSSS